MSLVWLTLEEGSDSSARVAVGLSLVWSMLEDGSGSSIAVLRGTLSKLFLLSLYPSGFLL